MGIIVSQRLQMAGTWGVFRGAHTAISALLDDSEVSQGVGGPVQPFWGLLPLSPALDYM